MNMTQQYQFFNFIFDNAINLEIVVTIENKILKRKYLGISPTIFIQGEKRNLSYRKTHSIK